MAVTYSISPSNPFITTGNTGQNTTVNFNVYRSGDISASAVVPWHVIDNTDIDNDVETNFFVGSSGFPSGTISFSAGASSATISVTLKGGINNALNGLDWAKFDLGVTLDGVGQSSGGFNQAASGGYGTTTNHYIIDGDDGILSLSYDMYSIPDSADVYLNGSKILSTGGSVSGTGVLNYPSGTATNLHAGDDIRVVITGSDPGTAWDYSINYAPGITAITEGHVLVDTGKPGIAELARLSASAYGAASSLNGYEPLAAQPVVDPSYAGFGAYAYANEDESRIVVAFRGTDPGSNINLFKNLLADSAFYFGEASPDYLREIEDGVAFLNSVRSSHPNSQITLTGHSLGGAVAQDIGRAGGYENIVFDAPGGGGALYADLQSSGAFAGLRPASSGGVSANYRLAGDQVSLVGTSLGTQYTVASPYGTSVLASGANHSIDTLVHQLEILGDPSSGVSSSTQNPGPNYISALQGAARATPINDLISEISFVGSVTSSLIDPSHGTHFVYSVSSDSPSLTSFSLPILDDVYSYKVQVKTAGSWDDPIILAPNTNYHQYSPFQAIQFTPLKYDLSTTAIPGSFYFETSFTTALQVKSTLHTQLGDQSSRSDFNADGTGDLLWHANNGVTAVATIQNSSQTQWINIGTIPNAFSVGATGDFNGDGSSDILWHASNGQTAIATMQSGHQIKWTDIGLYTPAFQVAGAGDFNGDGTTDILWQASNGQAAISTIEQNGQSKWTNTEMYPTAWHFADVGDFNGDGTADILWKADHGQIAISTFDNNHQTKWTDLGSYPLEFKFAGTGDFNGDGTKDFLWHASNGDTAISTIQNNGQTKWTDLGLYPTQFDVAKVGDFNGDGMSDIVWRATNGDAAIATMVNNAQTSWHDLGIIPPVFDLIHT